MMAKTQIEKVLNFLASGKQLTVSEARSRFGVQNLRSIIDRLRNRDGFTIYTNQKTFSRGLHRGRMVTTYRLDNADQEFVLSGRG